MNEIKLKVNFGKRTIVKSGISLTTGDYNSTKIIFEFDREDGTKIFEMINPDNELVFSDEIVNNEVILVGKAEVTTIHNDVTYTKYIDAQENVYWYDKETEKIYDDEFIEAQGITLDDLEIVTEDASLFTMAGRYVFEISLYDGNSKLTSKSDYLDVKEEQVVIDGNVARLYLPIFDRLVNEILTIEENIEEINSSLPNCVKFTDLATSDKSGVIKTSMVKGFLLDDSGVPKGVVKSISGFYSQDSTSFVANGTLQNLLEELIWNDSYATDEDAGLVKQGNGFKLNSSGVPIGQVLLYNYYQSASINQFISKGTLENVIEGKNLIDGATLNSNLTNYSLITETGSKLAITIDNSTYQMYITLKDKNDNVIHTSNTIDLPIEQLVMNVTYDNTNKAIVITLQNGNVTSVPVGALIDGLVSNDDLNTTLADYVKFTDYANNNKPGVMKAGYFSFGMDSTGFPKALARDYNYYQNTMNESHFIGKGTLENVITGKGLTTKSYVDGLVGDIATTLDTIQGEVI